MLNQCEHTARIEKLEAQNKTFAEQLAENTADTKVVKENTLKIFDVMQSWEGAMKVLERIGRFFRPIGYVAIFFSAIAAGWASIKTGITPK